MIMHDGRLSDLAFGYCDTTLFFSLNYCDTTLVARIEGCEKTQKSCNNLLASLCFRVNHYMLHQCNQLSLIYIKKKKNSHYILNHSSVLFYSYQRKKIIVQRLKLVNQLHA